MATTEQFSLRWNNFHSNLTSGFHDLLEAAEMVDVTLAVDGHFLQAHKIVLSICSPFFKKMFQVNPCEHPVVILRDVGHENMKDILEFMYMGEVSVLRENLTHFLRTAELLQVKGLTGDDSNEDVESTKDIKMKCDKEDDNDIYNQMIETDVELPAYPRSPPREIGHSPPLNKRSKSNCNNTALKRPKSEGHMPLHPQMPVKQEPVPVKHKVEYESNTADNPYLFNAVKPLADNPDTNEPLNMKTVWDNSISNATTSGDFNASEQDTSMGGEKSHVFCPHCYRRFVNRYNLKVHVRDKHEAHSTDLDCQICGKTMRNQSCLRVHMYHHRKQRLDSAETAVDMSSSVI